jgi:hypothetical protein
MQHVPGMGGGRGQGDEMGFRKGNNNVIYNRKWRTAKKISKYSAQSEFGFEVKWK